MTKFKDDQISKLQQEIEDLKGKLSACKCNVKKPKKTSDQLLALKEKRDHFKKLQSDEKKKQEEYIHNLQKENLNLTELLKLKST